MWHVLGGARLQRTRHQTVRGLDRRPGYGGRVGAAGIQAGTLGAQFSGTIWFDDIKIE